MDQEKIRVGFFLTDLYLIGAQRMCATILRYLDRKRFDPILFVLQKSGDVIEEIPPYVPIVELAQYSPISRVPKVRLLATPLAAARAICSYKPDVVISHTPLTNLVLLAQTYLNDSSPPIIIEEHQHLSTALKFDSSGFPPMFRWLYLKMLPLYNRATYLRCVSQASRDDFVENWGIKPDLACVIPPPFDLAKMDDEAKQIPDHPWFKEDIPIIIGVGRLTKQKNFQFLLHVFSDVIKHEPSRLIIVGEGAEYEPLRRLASKLGIEKDLHMPGYIVNARAWLAQSTVFVLSSVWEGRPAVICEALHLGVPVVSVDCPSGPNEMIEHGKSGLLTQPGDITDMSQAIVTVLRSQELRERFIVHGRQEALNYSPKKIIPKIESMLLQAVLEHPN
jgi:glycosyltransferase involved in cell wall biosynthesis